MPMIGTLAVEIVRGVPLGVGSAAMLDQLEEALRTRNIAPPASCRYSRYLSVLRARSGRVVSTSPTLEQLYATGELFQMTWIVSCFFDDDNVWPMIERAFFQDVAVPADVSTHSPGRDLQFELYVAARLQMAGMPPSFAEPDIRSRLSGWPFVVAAKRAKSRNGLLRQIRGARGQIEKAASDGIIAIDYSFVAAAEYLTHFQGDLEAGHAWAQGFSAKEFHAHWRSVTHAVSGTPLVFGAVIFARLFQLHPDRHTHVISELLFTRPLCADDDPRFGKFITIADGLRTSVLPSSTSVR
jgi:hypothetical protein